MNTLRSAVTASITVAALALLGACSGGGGAGPDAAGGAGGGGGAAGAMAITFDAGDASLDIANDSGGEVAETATTLCPAATGPLAAPDPALLIDDFAGSGALDGRTKTRPAFIITEQFNASANANFDPPPAVDPTCGAAAAGAAHIKGMAADAGALLAIIFSSGGSSGKPPAAFYDASATKGITFRAALGGDPTASKLFTVQVNLATSHWDYGKDINIDGRTWTQVDVLWSELKAAPGAPAFSAAMLNQIVFPLVSGLPVDVYIDDLAFIR